jgi:hypothetical protein
MFRAVLIGAFCGLPIAAQAVVINLDFSVQPPGVYDAADDSAVALAPGDYYWNDLSGSAGSATYSISNLKDSAGNTTAVSVSVTANAASGGTRGFGVNNVVAGLDALYHDFLFGNDTSPITISGLVPNTTVDLYIYGHKDMGLSSAYTFGGQSEKTLILPSNSASHFGYTTTEAGKSWIVFEDVPVSASGTVTGAVRGTINTNYWILNGLQIVGDPQYIPEPVSFALAAIPFGLLLRRVR